MVLRFHQDVIALKPKVVVILAGTNDIAGNTGPDDSGGDRRQSCRDGRDGDAHIRVVLCSVLPASTFPGILD